MINPRLFKSVAVTYPLVATSSDTICLKLLELRSAFVTVASVTWTSPFFSIFKEPSVFKISLLIKSAVMMFLISSVDFNSFFVANNAVLLLSVKPRSRSLESIFAPRLFVILSVLR